MEDGMDVTAFVERVGISLPEDQLSDILYHSSYQPQDSELLKRNKHLVTWGRLLIRNSCTVFLYLNEKELTLEKLMTLTNLSWHSVENSIYNKYGLEDFVIKSNGEIGKTHEDIASKLVALIYQVHGFLKVYDFVLPFLKDLESEKEIDFRSLIQEYAQRMKMVPIYEVIGTSGPDHEKKYTCKVSVGNQSATAEAIGKKNALKEVAKEFAKKYKVRPISKNPRKRTQNQQIEISSQRRKEIDFSIKSLQLDRRYISIDQLNEVLIHSSYLNERNNTPFNCNEIISCIGANVLELLSFEYICDNYDLSLIAPSGKKGILIQEENLSPSLSDDCIKYLLRSSKSTSGENEKTKIRMKVDVFKGILGFLWINYVSKKDQDIAEYTKTFTYKVLRNSDNNTLLEYTGFVQAITQKFNWGLFHSSELKQINTDNSAIHISTVLVQGPNWKEKGVGAGGNKISARNIASKDVLQKLITHCDDDEIKASISRMLDPELLFEYEIKKDEVQKGPQIGIENPVTTDTRDEIHQLTVETQKNGIKEEVSFDCNDHRLYICRDTSLCNKENHTVVCATGLLASLEGAPIRIDIFNCKTCNKYFINLLEYKQYQNIYKALLGNVAFRENLTSEEYDNNGVFDETILHLSGYTVNPEVNLSNDQRRRILGSLIDHNVLSKARIIEYLRFFIDNGKYKFNMQFFTQKWSEDLEWVKAYSIDEKRKYIISEPVANRDI